MRSQTHVLCRAAAAKGRSELRDKVAAFARMKGVAAYCATRAAPAEVPGMRSVVGRAESR
ncbi:hypothetical protein [Methylocella silvestris]|uniref:hypothetical protein n=1 Tax=Methylocella silvestris TaxID=199596 RepID=UPI00031ED5EE|nr:hypothetical protein [Methylocella silvestris]